VDDPFPSKPDTRRSRGSRSRWIAG
jgi:hypothetical protein